MPKNKDEQKKEKKPVSKKRIIISVSITVLCVALGGVGGYFIGNMVFRQEQTIDYSELKDVDFEDDHKALMKKYKASTASDYTKEFKPYELANIATEKFKEHDYVVSKQYGQVNAMGVAQTVRATSIKNKEEYFLENISASSMVQTGKRFYQKDGKVTTYNGENVETTKAKWNETPASELSLEEHEAKWGKDLSRPLIYIISSKTSKETSNSEKTSDGYTVRLDLSPKYSVLRYVRQMVEISPVKDPVFETVQLTLYLDSNLNLLSTEVDESYSVVMVVTANSVAHLTETYTYDVETTIPALSEDLEY